MNEFGFIERNKRMRNTNYASIKRSIAIIKARVRLKVGGYTIPRAVGTNLNIVKMITVIISKKTFSQVGGDILINGNGM